MVKINRQNSGRYYIRYSNSRLNNHFKYFIFILLLIKNN